MKRLLPHLRLPPYCSPSLWPGRQRDADRAGAALARSRVNQPSTTDLHRLWRTPIQRSDGFDVFAAKAAGGLRLEGELRDLVARIKYRGATR